MRLNHIDLHVPNVAETRDFFCNHLGFTLSESRGTDGLAILHDDAGLELVISRPVAKLGCADSATVGFSTYHIGFIVDTRAEVNHLHAALNAAGVEVGSGPREMRGGWRR